MVCFIDFSYPLLLSCFFSSWFSCLPHLCRLPFPVSFLSDHPCIFTRAVVTRVDVFQFDMSRFVRRHEGRLCRPVESYTHIYLLCLLFFILAAHGVFARYPVGWSLFGVRRGLVIWQARTRYSSPLEQLCTLGLFLL
ncbi:hypothetical protein PspLS_06523 [Pyricularia sp. CBS 133598]|nr:hypothetical protein PspLS_06523 [Pyricularia sp. CBS 133598]